MSVALARRLVWEGVVAAEDVNAALARHVSERTAFLAALARARPDLASRLDSEVGARAAEGETVVPDPDLTALLPKAMPAALLAVPLGRDPETGVIRVAAADPYDVHTAEEMAYHLGAPVQLTFARPGALIALLHGAAPRSGADHPAPAAPSAPAASSGPRHTPSFGTPVERSPSAPLHSRPMSSVPPSPPRLARQSEPPIPLVRLVPEVAAAPATVKGVAPQGSGLGHAPRVVVAPTPPAAPAPEPVIQLTRTKASLPAEQRSSSVPPDTVHGHAPAPGGQAVAAAPAPTLEDALAAMQVADSPEAVVSALLLGLAGVARYAVVLAARGKVFEGRDASDPGVRDLVRALVISGDRPSVLLTAVQAGSYVGPMPATLVHSELSRALGAPSGDIAVGVVTVSGRAALVHVAAGLDTAYLATRRGDQLSLAAGRALERIVRDRKK